MSAQSGPKGGQWSLRGKKLLVAICMAAVLPLIVAVATLQTAMCKIDMADAFTAAIYDQADDASPPPQSSQSFTIDKHYAIEMVIAPALLVHLYLPFCERVLYLLAGRALLRSEAVSAHCTIKKTRPSVTTRPRRRRFGSSTNNRYIPF